MHPDSRAAGSLSTRYDHDNTVRTLVAGSSPSNASRALVVAMSGAASCPSDRVGCAIRTCDDAGGRAQVGTKTGNCVTAGHAGRCPWRIIPHQIDEPARTDDLAGIQREDCQYGSAAQPSNRASHTVDCDVAGPKP